MVETTAPRILVLGGYGFIGAEVARRLSQAGYPVRGLGRDPAQMHPRDKIDWVTGDLRQMGQPDDWAKAMEGVAIVVNAAGNLQDSARDDVAAVHVKAIIAMTEAAARAGVRRIVQISAVGATTDARTEFLSTKASGDAAIRASGIDHIILRPGLVLGHTVYGGSGLLRMLAAVPLIQPLAFRDAKIQVVAMDDVTDAALSGVRGELPSGLEADLVTPEPVSLRDLIFALREWLGFSRPFMTFPIPGSAARLVGRAADGLGRLGWRSPLRTTAMNVIAEGVTGNSATWEQTTGKTLPGLETLLAARRATLQDRWHARLSLLFPILIAGLAVFWIASGLIGLIQTRTATAVLLETGMASALATSFVIGGAVADIILGVGILFRRWARPACTGMIVLSLGYLAAGSYHTPWLWADPLGPFLKVLPVVLLALVTRALLEER